MRQITLSKETKHRYAIGKKGPRKGPLDWGLSIFWATTGRMKAPLRLAINSRQHRAPRLLGARVEARLADGPHLEADLSRRLVVDDVAAVEDEGLVRARLG